MGVKTTLAGLTFTTAGKAAAEAAGLDLPGFMAEIELGLTEVNDKLNYLVSDILTPTGAESSNISTINTEITALS